MAKKRQRSFATAYGAHKGRQAAKFRSRARGDSITSGLWTVAGLAHALAGNPGQSAMAQGLSLLYSSSARKNRAKAASATAKGMYVDRLLAARGAAKRSSTVVRAARVMNRSVKRNGGGDGRVKGYYRSSSAGQVYVREHQRRVA